MKNVILILVLSGFSQLRAATDSIPIVVLPLEIPQAPPAAIKKLTTSLRSELAATGRFRVVTRDISGTLYKQYLYRLTDLHTKQQAEGAAAPADSILFKGVSKLIWGKINKVGKLFIINLRLVDISTSRVEHIVSYKHRGEREQLPAGIKQAVADLIQGVAQHECAAPDSG